MHASDFEIDLKYIVTEIKENSTQHYLDMQIQKPEPSLLKLGILYLYLYSKSYSTEKIRSICIATGLIQMGLDIHEWVKNEQLINPQMIENRQLQVLAGDYFSSKYYRLLATTGDIQSIRKIAHSVKKINEQKVIFYQVEDRIEQQFERWLSYKKDIEMGLFFGFIEPEDREWSLLIENFIQLEILLTDEANGKWNYNFIQPQYLAVLKNTKDIILNFADSSVTLHLQKYLLDYEKYSASSLVVEEL